MADARLERKVGLGGAVFLLVGLIVGASIFILPGQLAATAGPAVVFAYFIAGGLAIVNCLIAAQVGTILPVSAADYVFTSLVLHPMVGFLGVWAGMIGVAVGMPILAFGFADYMRFFLPEWDRLTIAVGIMLVLLGLNLLGLRTSVRTQMIMVAVFVSSLLIFGVGGIFYIDPANLTPMVPNGLDSVLSAAVPAFYSYSGFLTVVVVGEEIRNPGRNIPLALLLSFVVVAVIYTLVTIVLPGLVPWRELGAIVAPMSYASSLFLPDWFAVAITISALLAAATSINVVILAMSRSFFALARNRIYPRALSRVSKRAGEPDAAMVFVVLWVLAGIAAQGTAVQYASVTVIGVMIFGVIWAVALLRLPAAMPEHYAKAAFRLNGNALRAVAAIKIVVSVTFLYIGVRDNLLPGLFYIGLIALGVVYYFFRQRHLDRLGISLRDLLRNEAVEAAAATRAGRERLGS